MIVESEGGGDMVRGEGDEGVDVWEGREGVGTTESAGGGCGHCGCGWVGFWLKKKGTGVGIIIAVRI